MGEDNPKLALHDEMVDKFVWSNDSQYIMFSPGEAHTEYVKVVNIESNKVYTVVKYGTLPPFSPTSEYILFTQSADLNSPYLTNTETGLSHYVALLNLNTGEISTITEPNPSIEYIALGWVSDNKFMVKQTDNEKKTEEIVEMDLPN